MESDHDILMEVHGDVKWIKAALEKFETHETRLTKIEAAGKVLSAIFLPLYTAALGFLFWRLR